MDNDSPCVTLILTGQGLRMITQTHARTWLEELPGNPKKLELGEVR